MIFTPSKFKSEYLQVRATKGTKIFMAIGLSRGVIIC